MSEGLEKAKIIPFKKNSEQSLIVSKAITFDFNPETLKIKVLTGEAGKKKKRGNQQQQNVGVTKATLSFDAVFDNTRPNNNASDEEKLDIRYKTQPIANLLKAEKKGKESAARKIKFIWGTIIFDGIITSFDETLEYFSKSGVPLRSKLSITISENNFKYKVTPKSVKENEIQRKLGKQESALQNKNTNTDKSLNTGEPFKVKDKPAPETEATENKKFSQLEKELGLNKEFEKPHNSVDNLLENFDLPIADALNVFGESILSEDLFSTIDFGSTSASKNSPAIESDHTKTPDPAMVQSEWATVDAPKTGSKGNKIASLIKQQQQSASNNNIKNNNVKENQTNAQQSFRGSPPQQKMVVLGTRSSVYPKRQVITPESRCDLSNRPHWENLKTLEFTNTKVNNCTQAIKTSPLNGDYKHG